MEFGITLPTKADSWKIAKRAEELGFTHAWFYDSASLKADVFVAMGAAAVTTSRIKLCAGVLTPSNRLPQVAASGLASLNALAPGRIMAGYGTGFTARRTLGLPPVTQKKMEAYIRAVEGLLRGEIVRFEMEGKTAITRLMSVDEGLINIADPIPTHISAFGPKGRELTARLGAGWMGTYSVAEEEEAGLNDMRAQWERHGRDFNGLYSTMVAAGCVLDDDESYDSPRFRAQAGPQAAILFHNFVEQEAFGTALSEASFPFHKELEEYRKVYESYQPAETRHLSNHRGHLLFVRPDETHLTGEVIRALSFSGTRDELVARIRGIRDMGYSQMAFGLPPGQEEDVMMRWRSVIENV